MTPIERWLQEWLVVRPAALLDRLTRRRIIHILALVILFLCIQQVMALGPDAAVLFGMDWGLLAEIGAALAILAVQDRVKTAYLLVRHALVRAQKPLVKFCRRARAAKAAAARMLEPPPVDEDGAASFA